MGKDVSAAEQLSDNAESKLSSSQVADYLRIHPEFFVERDDLLAELSLPH